MGYRPPYGKGGTVREADDLRQAIAEYGDALNTFIYTPEGLQEYADQFGWPLTVEYMQGEVNVCAFCQRQAVLHSNEPDIQTYRCNLERKRKMLEAAVAYAQAQIAELEADAEAIHQEMLAELEADQLAEAQAALGERNARQGK